MHKPISARVCHATDSVSGTPVPTAITVCTVWNTYRALVGFFPFCPLLSTPTSGVWPRPAPCCPYLQYEYLRGVAPSCPCCPPTSGVWPRPAPCCPYLPQGCGPVLPLAHDIALTSGVWPRPAPCCPPAPRTPGGGRQPPPYRQWQHDAELCSPAHLSRKE